MDIQKYLSFFIFNIIFNSFCKEPIPMYVTPTINYKILQNDYFYPSLNKIDDNIKIIVYTPEKYPEFRYIDRAKLALKAIKENWGKTFIYSDLDIVFYKQFTHLIPQLLEDYDLAIQRGYIHGNCCTGFFIMKANERTLKLWQKVHDLMEKDPKNTDEFYLFKVLTEDNTKWRYLPDEFFHYGLYKDKLWTEGKKIKIPNNMILFHACRCPGLNNKIELLNLVQNIEKSKFKNNYITHGKRLQLGDNILRYSIAKILSLKYEMPLKYCPFKHDKIFSFTDYEKIVKDNSKILADKAISNTVLELNEQPKDMILNEYEFCDYLASLNNTKNIISINQYTEIDFIKPEWINELKKSIALKNPPKTKKLPSDKICVAVHIRKGNGGSEVYDGKLKSKQIFDYDHSMVKYYNDFYNYPFDSILSKRNYDGKIINIKNQLDYVQKDLAKKHNFRDKNNIDNYVFFQMKLPPEQYYIDQIRKLYFDLNQQPLFIQIFTDDKEPEKLIHRIKENFTDLPEIQIYYHNNRNKDIETQIREDLTSMSKFDILIRAQSNFSRIVELMCDYKLVIYPIDCKWIEDKLIMTKIVMLGNLNKLRNKNPH